MELSGIEEAIAVAQRRWPGFEFRAKNAEEACGPCPICHKAEKDGFIIWANGYYLCRPGGEQGWLDEDDRHTWTKEEIRLRRIEAEQARARRERQEIWAHLTALQRLNRQTDHIRYHLALTENDCAWWHGQGIVDASIDAYQLGTCDYCPMDYPDHRPSYTIPIYTSDGKTLLNIRHRLQGQLDGDRYRPHMIGLPGKVLFNARFAVTEPEALLTEGCKKSIVLEQYGYPAMAVLGKHGFNLA